MLARIAFLFSLAISAAAADKIYTYVGDIGSDYVLIAWGTTASDHNSIGRDSSPLGNGVVKFGDQTVTATDRNWAIVRNLKPDTQYNYEVDVNNNRVGGGTVRTNAEHADKVCFFVIGDWGSGQSPQYRVAEAMRQEFERRQNTDCPVRFILSMGDNIYGEVGLGVSLRGTGDRDSDWERKFFVPYAALLAHIPFHPVLGNHDGDESESPNDTPTYMDNFFFPNQQPARWYKFQYADLAEFFALDSTRNTYGGVSGRAYAPEGEQYKWLRDSMKASTAPWKIPYFHHPPFNAGPRHPSEAPEIRHFLTTFAESGVKLSFSGHEHNFQFTEISPETYNIRFIVSGSGGELRTNDVRKTMGQSHTAGWAPQVHFCVVELDRQRAVVTPLSFAPVSVRDRSGNQVQMPVVTELGGQK